jgi:hypothetical protein
MITQGIEFICPELPIRCQPSLKLSQGGGIETVKTAWAINPHHNKTRFSQGLKVLGDVWLWQCKGFNKRPRRLLTLSKQGEQVATDGIGDGCENFHNLICVEVHMPVNAYEWSRWL